MLKDMLIKNCMNLNLKGKSKEEVIDEMIDMLMDNGRLNDREEYKKEILKREAQSSTGLEEGIAIPHAKTKAVKIPSIAFGRSLEGVDYDSLDGEPSKLFFMIAAPADATDSHIEVLSKLTTLLLDDDLRENLLKAKTKDEILNLLLNEGKAKEEEKEEELEDDNQNFTVLAVTACPTGIAHTYMAADTLMKKAREMGITLKVETNGSTGVKNRLTDEEIKNAKGIIVAADKNVEMDRFHGKNVEIVPVIEGIKNPEKLIRNAVEQKAKIYKAQSGKSEGSSEEKKGFYKHLMSGVSNMLPFVVGGGILIALSFMFGIKSADPTDPSFNVIAKLLKDIGGDNAFFLMVPVMAGFIGMSIADRPGFAPAMVAGLISANNGAGFLGALIGGFLGGYIVLLLKRVLRALPESLEGLKPVLFYPVFGILITGVLMYKVILTPVAALNNGMTSFLGGLGTGNLVLLGVILAGMMAIDMGGPINKASFTFGIAMIAAGNYYPHAAVMAGGMVPPLGIALATTIYKNRFTKDER
ncbi:fructose-specific PTS transporter subunit EIIC, partial [Fusobacterium sp.]|uniref:PTS fructose transporter subunit IIABC n=1 Tax=Fusobacterium sp. TaxID=68766 RepID=UPI00262439C4